jgi:hypothetical protein
VRGIAGDAGYDTAGLLEQLQTLLQYLFRLLQVSFTKLGTGTDSNMISGKSESDAMDMCCGASRTSRSNKWALACGPIPPIIPIADIIKLQFLVRKYD